MIFCDYPGTMRSVTIQPPLAAGQQILFVGQAAFQAQFQDDWLLTAGFPVCLFQLTDKLPFRGDAGFCLVKYLLFR